MVNDNIQFKEVKDQFTRYLENQLQVPNFADRVPEVQRVSDNLQYIIEQ
jgi:hypothetical protein